MGTTQMLLVPTVLSFPERHVHGNVQYVTFGNGLLPLSTELLKPITLHTLGAGWLGHMVQVGVPLHTFIRDGHTVFPIGCTAVQSNLQCGSRNFLFTSWGSLGSQPCCLQIGTVSRHLSFSSFLRNFSTIFEQEQ